MAQHVINSPDSNTINIPANINVGDTLRINYPATDTLIAFNMPCGGTFKVEAYGCTGDLNYSENFGSYVQGEFSILEDASISCNIYKFLRGGNEGGGGGIASGSGFAVGPAGGMGGGGTLFKVNDILLLAAGGGGGRGGNGGYGGPNSSNRSGAPGGVGNRGHAYQGVTFKNSYGGLPGVGDGKGGSNFAAPGSPAYTGLDGILASGYNGGGGGGGGGGHVSSAWSYGGGGGTNGAKGDSFISTSATNSSSSINTVNSDGYIIITVLTMTLTLRPYLIKDNNTLYTVIDSSTISVRSNLDVLPITMNDFTNNGIKNLSGITNSHFSGLINPKILYFKAQ